jgi:hypothetical protein
MFLSVWRPIGDSPVENFPLAFMDGSSVPEDKLIVVDVVRRSFPGESYYPLEGGGYRWHFLNHQTQDEVLFMKMNDSKESVKAKCKSGNESIISTKRELLTHYQVAPMLRLLSPRTQEQSPGRA